MSPSTCFQRVFKTVLCIWLCISSVIADPYPIKGAGHGVQPRLEIRTLKKHSAMWNIYILALQAFQADKENNKLSYYQIGGIHGVPNIAWDGVEQQADGTGYCNHDSPLFPTWHRPYIALFEQVLNKHAVRIARRFKGREQKKYLKAAQQLRSPYWDWAIQPGSDGHALPSEMTASHVTVHSPTHGKQTIKNPLYSYHYHPLESDWYVAPWSNWQNTLRYPRNQHPGAKSQESQAIQSVDANRASTQSQLFQFFTKCKSWLEMSNDVVRHHNPGCSTSLETIHNNIHGEIGGYFGLPDGSYFGGHMTVIPYSGHEPSFFLHHTQIDRLFAMWQELYPDHYVAEGQTQESSFVIPAGTTVGRSTPLYPFHKNTQGDFWTSAEVRSTKVFGYTYPEVKHSGGSPKKMRKIINHLYGPHATKHAKRDSLSDATTANNGSTFEWNANIATTRFKLGNSYGVFVFFGEPASNDATTWSYDPNCAGTMGVFAAPGMQDSNVITQSTVPLNEKLIEQISSGQLATLAEADVIPFLTKNLNVKIAGPKGIMDPTDVPDFDIQVVASTLQPTNDSTEFPVWSPPVPLSHITTGLLNGAGGILSNTTGSILGGL